MRKNNNKATCAHWARDGVYAVISICNVFGQEVESRHTPVLLQNMSPTGLQFLTHLRFPVNNNYTIRLLITFNEWELQSLSKYSVAA